MWRSRITGEDKSIMGTCRLIWTSVKTIEYINSNLYTFSNKIYILKDPRRCTRSHASTERSP